MQPCLRVQLEDVELKDILDRVLDGCIVFSPSVRVRLAAFEVSRSGGKVSVAPERRHKPFVIPSSPRTTE